MHSTRLLLLAMTLTAATYASDAPCGDCQTKKVCVPETRKKTITHNEYSVKCVDICLPHCSLGGLFGQCCDADQCGKPHTVRRLMKRVVKEETCQTVCKVVEIPVKPAAPCAPAACPPAPCAPGGAVTVTPPTPPAVLPAR